MKGFRSISAVAVLGLIVTAGAARADYCVSINNGSYVVVGKRFSIPAKGHCKAWVGFVQRGTGSDANSPSSGAGCRSSDGTTFNLMFTTAFPEQGAFFEEDQMSLSMPDQTGTDYFQQFINGRISYSSDPAVGYKCSRNPVPAIRGETTGAPLDSGDRAN